MTRRDLLAGARQWWFIDGTADVFLLAWYVLLAGTALIAAAPLWLALLLLVPPVVGSAVSIWRRGLANRDAREFYEWVVSSEALDWEREQLPETD